MSLLKSVSHDQIDEEIKPLYQGFLDTLGMVPPPFSLLGTSPGLQSVQAELMGYYRERSGLSPLLQALIRYLTAVALEMDHCVEFNTRVLAAHGMSVDQIAALQTNPAAAPLEEKEGWLLALAIKAVRAPETLSGGHVEKLRELGWSDADILDALYLPFMMTGMKGLMRALKISE